MRCPCHGRRYQIRHDQVPWSPTIAREVEDVKKAPLRD
jgi:Rieske Fe-S protein